ncbi:MAG: hypothetical protein IPG55_08860 [Saprospiraceae bacterium]|nr:hypothetical protein [Candidatus Defluviibacterium haderslevense]MBK7243480.1 hypothetical protein [Candidatus Defluviibacterium haderslevense]
MNIKIKLLGRLFLELSIFTISCQRHEKEQYITLKTLPINLLEKNGAEIFQCWEFKNDTNLWDTNFVQPSSLKLFKDSLSRILGKDTFKHNILKLAFQDTSYKIVNTKNGDTINAQLIHSNTLEK